MKHLVPRKSFFDRISDAAAYDGPRGLALKRSWLLNARSGTAVRLGFDLRDFSNSGFADKHRAVFYDKVCGFDITEKSGCRSQNYGPGRYDIGDEFAADIGAADAQ